MISPRIRCQVVEVPAAGHLESSAARATPRDLLPWADPYIAALLEKVERDYWTDDPEASNFDEAPYDADRDAELEAEAEEMYGKFFPVLDEAAPVGNELPRIYGGWPLLDDLPRSEAPRGSDHRFKP